MKRLIPLFVLPLLLINCASANIPSSKAHLSFQNGQQAQLNIQTEDPALRAAFQNWAGQGLYTNAPVYRQLPGVFLLTGKPRLAGKGYVDAPQPTPHPKGKPPKSAGYGDIGLVIHADGTVGPEIILHYGTCFTTCAEAPANIRIGTITSGARQLKSVQRGDNLTAIIIQ